MELNSGEGILGPARMKAVRRNSLPGNGRTRSLSDFPLQTPEQSTAEQSLVDSHAALFEVRAGENSALWRMSESLRPWLKHVARQELGNGKRGASEDDSDLVQRTLVKAVQGIAEFRGSSLMEWRAWLAVIARNEARASRRYSKAGRRSISREVSLTDGPHPVSKEESPSAATRQSELGDRLRLAVDQLTPDHRQLVQWRQEEGLSHAEIASRLEIAVDAARQRCKSAMDALRKIWSGNE